MSRFGSFACAVVAALAYLSPASAQFAGQKPELLRITNLVCCATGYALGNVIFIKTDRSVVVVDTTESEVSGRRALDDFRKDCSLPIRYIIYTHSHGDHIHGARAFKEKGTQVIAQKAMPRERAKLMALADYQLRVAAVQFGSPLPPAERGVSLAVNIQPDGRKLPPSGYVPPDILFDEEYSFEEGGVRFELYHTLGETVDHLMVWMPGERVMLPGDLYYASFPMLSSPMKPDRPVLDWAESLERMRKFQPEYLVPSHLQGVKGRDEVDATLANYARAIRFVHNETVKRIKAGQSLEEIRQEVRLPDDLARLPYLAQRYGRLDWAVNGIYRQYTGWYDFDPAHLNPGRRAAFSKALLEASGGTDLVLARAEKALGSGQPQLTVELAEVVLDVQPGHRGAHALSARALEELAASSTNTVEVNIYRGAAREHRKFAEKP
jgi:alkyl sulfatase BDS1-like metallo-beta-lactamase superfamily hydrolase